MATSKTRVAAYLPSHIEEQFNSFKTENGLDNDSKAIIHILASFFGVAHSEGFEVAHSGQYATVERVEALEAQVSELLKLIGESQNKIIEDAVSDVKSELISELRSDLPVVMHLGQLGLLPEESHSEFKTDSLEADSLDELSEGFLNGLSAVALGKYISADRKAIGRRKNKPEELAEFTRVRDPRGCAWRYEADSGKYYPLGRS